MVDLIAGGDAVLTQVQKIADSAAADKNFPLVAVEDVNILAPIQRTPKNIFCVGKNYVEHALEFEKTRDANVAVPKFPVIFSKPATCITGPNTVVKRHPGAGDQIDYEVELAIVIGKEGINIKHEEAEDYIFGYTIINDVSARDLQVRHKQWFKAKSLDTFCPMGPCLVHKSHLPLPVRLDIKSFVNGELRQNSNTNKLIFDIPYIISDLSQGFTLKPGDVIATGTPSGVGFGFNPPKLLSDGDVVECYIEKIGSLVNKVKSI
jgi:2-keto-4-pentenoate hydratase/2-oxohepta-3-ene-1,7-dioic acid hydratase in catechol pathway